MNVGKNNMKVERKKRKRKSYLDRLLTLFIVIVICLLVWLFLQIFCFTTFKIPSDSMEPALIAGDEVIVNKMIYGARLFNISRALNREDVDIYRLPGMGNVERNDIVVFNYPYPDRNDSISFDVMQYYIKRCVALPGDTFEIKDTHYKVKGVHEELGSIKYQNMLDSVLKKGGQDKFYHIVLKGFPHDTIVNWSIKDFGPLYIPREGDRITMNRLNWVLYRELIEWEQHEKLQIKDGRFYLGNKFIVDYLFRSNYYFVAGDKVMNSKDSRYWGMLPEEYIVGKATRIWYSEDKFTEKPRWDRIMKKIK